MLKEICKYQNLGTREYYFQLLNSIKNNSLTREDLNKLFYNKIIEGRSVFDGCIDLIFYIKAVKFNDQDQKLSVSEKIEKGLENIEVMSDLLVELVFSFLKDDDDFLNIFLDKNLKYDSVYESLQIKNSAFGFKYASFKQFLLDFEILQIHPLPNTNSYLLNSKYKVLLKNMVFEEKKRKKISVEEFERRMILNQDFGEEAEKFVLEFEIKRLNNQKTVTWVAEYIVNEGYDVASFNLDSDTEHNRFIEVKSYKGETPYFYWSVNEFKTAKLKKNNYWLYLVNRDKIQGNNYTPEMIQNPYDKIIKNDEWIKEIEGYKVSLNHGLIKD